MALGEPELSHEEIEAIVRRIDRPVVLVGMMGVGKSSVGKKLAMVLDCPFVDADEAIEIAAGMTIPEIFEAHGEAYFRDGERRVIARLIKDGAEADGGTESSIEESNAKETNGRSVIATGGGAFCNAETRALILDQAIAIWLDSDVDTLVERTARKDNRPLLKEGDPREILGRLREERRPAYSQAPIHIMSTNGPHGRAVQAALRGIDKWL